MLSSRLPALLFGVLLPLALGVRVRLAAETLFGLGEFLPGTLEPNGGFV